MAIGLWVAYWFCSTLKSSMPPPDPSIIFKTSKTGSDLIPIHHHTTPHHGCCCCHVKEFLFPCHWDIFSCPRFFFGGYFSLREVLHPVAPSLFTNNNLMCYGNCVLFPKVNIDDSEVFFLRNAILMDPLTAAGILFFLLLMIFFPAWYQL